MKAVIFRILNMRTFNSQAYLCIRLLIAQTIGRLNRYREVSYPVLGPHMDQLKEILEKEAQLPAHKRQTSKKIYGLLQNEGYEGGYDAVRRYISNWKEQQGTGMKNAYIPQQFEKGEAFQFD